MFLNKIIMEGKIVRRHTWLTVALLMIFFAVAGVNAQKHMVQVKTFDENIQPYRNVEISINGKDYLSVGSKGVAFADIPESELPPASVKIKDETLEPASWNYTKGVLQIIVRKKNYEMISVRVVDETNVPLPGLRVVFKGKSTLENVTDANGMISVPHPLGEAQPQASQFLVSEYLNVGLSLVNSQQTLVVKPVVSEEIVAKKTTANPTNSLDFDLSNLDSIQSLTVFYSVFKKQSINSLPPDVRRRVDQKFQQLVAQMIEPTRVSTETLFLGKISDTSVVSDDVRNLISQAEQENNTLDGQRAEFDEKIQIITEKLAAGIDNLDADTRTRLLSDLARLQAMLAENEGRFYKNQNYYKEVIASLREKYFDFEDIENKLYMSEAQRMEEQKVFRERLFTTISLIILFGILIIRLIYFSNQLRKEKKKLQEANEAIKTMNENLEGLVFQRTRLLEEANRELDTFLYRASHDLRSPVCSIIGLCNLASHFSSGEAKELLDKVVNTTSGMDRMLKKLSLISEINQPSDFSAVNVADTIESTRQMCYSFMQMHNISMVVSCEPHVKINTYPNLLEAIFNNLIENAMFFTSLKGAEHSVIEVKAWEDGMHLYITIRDNGVGIEKKFTDKLFSMFFKGNVFSKGNGLGLYIVRKSVYALGGAVDIESEAGVYTLARVVLPLKQDKLQQVTQAGPTALREQSVARDLEVVA